MKQKFSFSIFFIIIVTQSPLFALKPLLLTDSQEEYPLGLYLEILEDKEKKFSIDDVSSQGLSQRFIENGQEIPNFGYTDSAFWMRLHVINNSSGKDWLMEIADPLINRIQIFIPYKDSKCKKSCFHVKESGDSIPFSRKEIYQENQVFTLSIDPGTRQTIYLRIAAEESIQFPATMFSFRAFAEAAYKKRIAFGIYYGIILAMFFYNLFLYLSLRDRNYLYYILYIAIFIVLNLSITGMANEYLWPDFPWLNNISIPFLAASLVLCLSVFSRSFLATKINAPIMDKLFLAMMGLGGLEMILSLIADYNITIRISGILAMAYTVFTLIAGLTAWRKGYRPAKYYVIAWILFMAGTFLYLLRDFGLLPHNTLTIYGMQIGSAVEVLLISLALADRINVMKQEKEEAQALAIENLHIADKLKDEFLANTSHELKTPLNGIIGIAETMMNGRNISPGQKMRLFMILSSGRRLLNMVNEILDFSKLKHHDIVLQKKPVDMRQAAELIIILSRPLLSGKPVTLDNAIREDLPPVLGDEDRIQQIMHNLIGNAIKFTESGTIKVSADISRDFLEIKISDTGIGIPEEKLESIFRPFEQADASISRLYGGTGLGLSITRQLIELHGGVIRVNSKPGKGSEFIFTLPVCADREAENRDIELEKVSALKQNEAEETIAADLLQADAQQAGSRILAVDDDRVNLQVIADQLAGDGYAVSLISGGSEALDAIEKEKFDLVILDVMMPRMSGYEVCRKIREKYSGSELPVIMLTAKSRVQDLIEGLDSGANDYISKPVSKGELSRRVKTHLENASYYKQLKQLNEHLDSLMKDFSRLTAKIHNSLKNKLESLHNFLSHSIRIHDDREKLTENLRIAKNLVFQCSAESKNILFVTTHKECTIAQFLEELELQAGVAFSGLRIKYAINKSGLPMERILSLGIILNLLDIYTEILNNIVKHSAATDVEIRVQYADAHLSISVIDNGIGFEYTSQREKKGSYGLIMLEDLAHEIGALLEVISGPGHGSAINISVDV